MPRSYVEFEIAILARQGDSYPYSAFCSLGGSARGVFVSPGDDPGFAQLLTRLEKLEANDSLLREIGERLFEALFQGDLLTIYLQARNALEFDQALRLKFNIGADAAEVASLPWEFLREPGDAAALALLDCAIVRYLPQTRRAPPLKATLPLRILLTGAQTPPKPDVVRELAAVREALRPFEERQLAQITVDEHLTSRGLLARMREGYHVWHFIGHGDQSGESGALLLETADGDTDPIRGEQLTTLLYRSGVRLIVLSACNSANLRSVAPLRAVAPSLIQAQTSTVVAMQFKVPRASSRVFAHEFYQSLVSGQPLDSCVTDARKALMLDLGGADVPDWGIPVFYSSAPDSVLFTPDETRQTEVEQLVSRMYTPWRDLADLLTKYSEPGRTLHPEEQERLVQLRRELTVMNQRAIELGHKSPIAPWFLKERE